MFADDGGYAVPDFGDDAQPGIANAKTHSEDGFAVYDVHLLPKKLCIHFSKPL